MVQWWCRLPKGESGDPVALGRRARQLGVQAWVVDVAADANGRLTAETTLAPLLEAAEAGGPQVCLMVQLRTQLTPMAENHLAMEIAPWMRPPTAPTLAGHPVLMVGTHEGFSHIHYGPRRFRLNLRIALRQAGLRELPVVIGPDSRTTSPWAASLLMPAESHGSYLKQLQRAHHGPWPEAPFIPAVMPPPEGSRQEIIKLYNEWLAQAGAVSWFSWGGEDAVVLVKDWAGHQRIRPRESGVVLPYPLHPRKPSEQERSQHLDSSIAGVNQLYWGTPRKEHLAVMLHGFYLDRLEELLLKLPRATNDQTVPALDLYVSTPREQLHAVEALLRNQGWPRARLFGVENRGRDIAPFLFHLLPEALSCGHHFFIKAHTKRSTHLRDGSQWSEHLSSSLLTPEALSTCLQLLNQKPTLGLLAPAGTLMPCTVALESNASHLMDLHQHFSVPTAPMLQQAFIAGSMMAGRLDAVRPMAELGLKLADFEPELGQTDGTLAHALERWLCCTAAREGWQLGELPGDARAVPGFGYAKASSSRTGTDN